MLVHSWFSKFHTKYCQQAPFVFNIPEFTRFIVLTLLTAPPNYKWQQLLEQSFPAYAPSTDPALPLSHREAEKRRNEDASLQGTSRSKLNIKNTLTKWFIDCMTAGALMNTVVFIVLMGLMKGQPVGQIYQNVRTVSGSSGSSSSDCEDVGEITNLLQQTVPIIFAGYKVWPIVSIVCFSFVPVEKRIVFFSAVGLLWGIYMSLVAARI